jgi:hypothetical protein
MNDRSHVVGAHRAHNKVGVSDIANDKRRLRRDGPTIPGRQVVEYDDFLPATDEFKDHVAADIAGAAGDEDCHGFGRPACVAKTLNLTVWQLQPS